MKLIMFFLLLLPSLSFAKSYKCNLEQGSGNVNLFLSNSSSADVELLYQGGVFNYNECKANKDEFGILIDCKSGNLDFMILLNDKVSPAAGGVMSSTHDLFVDIKC